MKNTYKLVLGLGIAAASLSSCSRANYAFNSTAPAYLGTESVHTSVAATPLAPETLAAETTTEAVQPAVKVTPAHRVAHVAARHAAKAPVTAKADVAVADAPVTAPAKLSRKAFKQELKRQLAAAPQGTNAEGKSQLVALLLCFFLGGLGIHDFYLGRVGKGILQILLTLLFGIGFILVVIDFIRILIGTEKPKDGDYAKKL